MNFIETFNFGQSDLIKGIPFGKGLESLTRDLNGIQRRKLYVIGGGEKTGKSTFVDYSFILQPYLFCLERNIPIDWIYFSFEIDRVSKEFDFVSYFLNYDYKINLINLPDGQLVGEKPYIELSSEYLKGYIIDDNNKPVKVSSEIKEKIKEVYYKRIVPLFGEFDSKGFQKKKGLISFYERRNNPTGIYKQILEKAEQDGEIVKNEWNSIIGYVPKNKDKVTIVILDHIRKINVERGWTLKQSIDKMSDYIISLRDLIGWTFVPIIHTNRDLSDIKNLNHLKGDVYPTSDNIKDSGNLGEDCNYLLTIFNPNDDKYALKEHFGLKIRDSFGNIINKNLKTIHLVSSRNTYFPRHYKVNMIGNLKKFEKVI